MKKVVMIFDYKSIVQYGLIAFLGGVCRVLAKEKFQGKKLSEIIFRIITGGIISCFTGIVVFFLLASYIPDKPMLVAGLVGIAGWSSPAIMDTLGRSLKVFLKEIIK